MRKRSLILSTFLLVAVLFLGLGYAALTNTLNIGGTIGSTPDNNNLDVRFVNDTTLPAATKVSSDNIAVGGFNYEAKSVTFGVSGFSSQGDKAIVVLRIANNSAHHPEYDAQLSSDFAIGMTHGESKTPAVDENDVPVTQNGNKLTGEHYEITVQYISEYTKSSIDGNDETVRATGDLNGGSPILQTVDSTNSLQTNEYIFVMITVEVISPIVEVMDEHQFTVSFTATTIE